MQKKDACTQYLSRYAEPELELLTRVKALEAREYALLIPAYDEDSDFVQRIAEHPQAARCTLILVLNSPDSRDASPAANARLLDWFNKEATTLECHGKLSTLRVSNLQILLVDRTTAGWEIPQKQGVGLARKIAADIALSLIQSGKINCEWIHSTDADASLPDNYFDAQAAVNTPGASAICYDFRHRCDDSALGRATGIYEACIRYFAESLKQAGSAYAYHALGSCLAVRAEAYASVRGFPKRAGGEDFYLLNKLAKIGEIIQTKDIVVELAARCSARVPFGTGPAVAKMMRQFEQGEIPRYYDPRIFDCLAEVQESIARIWRQRHSPDLALAGYHPEIAKAMQEAKLGVFLEKRARQDKNLESFKRAFENWFDAFQTLKFLHRMRANMYPSISIDKIPLQALSSSSILSLQREIDGQPVYTSLLGEA